MPYSYQTEKAKVFSEHGQEMFLAIRDASRRLLDKAGAFRYQELIHESGVTGDSWTMIACVDRLVEIGEIVELPRNCWTQYKVYTTNQVHNL